LLYRVGRLNHPRHPGNTGIKRWVQEVRSKWEWIHFLQRLHWIEASNLTGANVAGIFGICWVNSGRAVVRVNIAACK